MLARENNLLKQKIRELFFPLALVLLLIVVGISGLILIEGYDFVNALYMTVITLATVGYTEPIPLTPKGKIFISGLIISGVGSAAIAFGTISRIIIRGELGTLRRQQRMERERVKLSGHTIICGFGRLGSSVAKELSRLGEQVIVIERNELLKSELESLKIPFLIGDAEDDDVLKAARIVAGKQILALLPKDADNVYVVLCAKELNPNIQIVARSEAHDSEKKLIRAGAHRVVAPYKAAAIGLVQQLLRPNVSSFLELTVGRLGANTSGGQGLVLEEVVVGAKSLIAGKTIAESEVRSQTGAMIAAIIPKNGTMIFNPSHTEEITSGATLIVLGNLVSVDKLADLAK